MECMGEKVEGEDDQGEDCDEDARHVCRCVGMLCYERVAARLILEFEVGVRHRLSRVEYTPVVRSE